MNLLNEFVASAKTATSQPTGAVMFGEDMELGCESIADFTVNADVELMQIASAENEANNLQLSMENILGNLSNATEAGTMRPETIDMVFGVYANLTSNYEGLRPEGFEVPSMESITAEGAITGLTEYATESVSETIAKIIKATKDMIDAAIKAALKFYDQHMALAGRVRKNSAKLQEKVKSIKGGPKEAELSFSAIKKLTVAGTVPSADKVAKVYKNAATKGGLIKAALKKYRKALSAIDPKDLDTSMGLIIEATLEYRMALVDGLVKHQDYNDLIEDVLRLDKAQMDGVFTSTVLAGNKLICYIPHKDNAKIGYIKEISIASKYNPVEKVKALDIAGISLALATANDVVESHDALIKEARLIAAIGKELSKEIDNAAKVLKGIEGDADATKANAIVDHIKNTKNILAVARQPFIAYAKNMALYADASVMFAQASMKNLGQKKD